MQERTQTMDVWTWGYFPFTLGGEVDRPLKCSLPIKGPFDLEAGYQAFTTESPAGQLYVVESTSGGIVGTSLEEVNDDIQTGDLDLMAEQVETATAHRKRAQAVTPEKFWKLLLRAPKGDYPAET